MRNFGARCADYNAKCEVKEPVVRGQVPISERFALIIDKLKVENVKLKIQDLRCDYKLNFGGAKFYKC